LVTLTEVEENWTSLLKKKHFLKKKKSQPCFLTGKKIKKIKKTVDKAFLIFTPAWQCCMI